MRFVLYVLAAVALLYGTLITLAAKSSIHEIQAGIAFLMFAVFLSGAVICSYLAGLAGLKPRAAEVGPALSHVSEPSRADRSYPPQ